MFFSKKPDTILYVQRTSLRLYPKKGGSDALPLPEDTVRYLEVVDPKRLHELLAEFARKHNLRDAQLLVVLSKDVVFQKAIDLTNGTDAAALVADFEHKLPFNPSSQQAVSIRQKDRLFLFGANRDFYTQLVAILHETGTKVIGVVPAVAYGITDAAKVTPAKLEQIRNASAMTRTVNFL